MKNMNTRNFIVWGVVIALFFAMITAANTDIKAANTDDITYSELKELVDSNQIESVLIDVEGGKITGTLAGNKKFTTNIGSFNLDADELFEGRSIPR